jgi:uncharacterized protein (DUF983 family)
MLARGLIRHCPRCGGRRIVERWFRLKERCPTCGHRFKREEGFFTGVLLINFGTTLALLWLFIVGWLIWHEATGSDAGLAPILLTSVGIALVLPIVFYPFASTIWAALDLAMRPLEPVEIAEAETWLDAAGGPPAGRASR